MAGALSNLATGGADDAALNAASGAGSVARPHQKAAVDHLVSPMKLDPNDPNFLDMVSLALKHEREVLTRLLAESPLSEADRIAIEKERGERNGESRDGGIDD